MVAALWAATAAAGDLPPLADPPGDLRPGKFVWIDLVTADVAGARRFYGGLFGWAFAEVGTGRGAYTLAYAAGAPVAGLAARKPATSQARQSRWVAYVSVPDVDGSAAAIAGQGGRVLVPPADVAGRGRMAIVADPDGAPFGLVRSSSGDPADFRAEPGEWIWAVYQAADAQGAAAFYQSVGGYDVVPSERLEWQVAFQLQAEGFARASLVEIPAARPDLRPDWVYFVRVRDIGASLARVGELGGRVVVGPRPELLEGRMAVVADPAGAPVGLMQWSDDGEER